MSKNLNKSMSKEEQKKLLQSEMQKQEKKKKDEKKKNTPNVSPIKKPLNTSIDMNTSFKSINSTLNETIDIMSKSLTTQQEWDKLTKKEKNEAITSLLGPPYTFAINAGRISPKSANKVMNFILESKEYNDDIKKEMMEYVKSMIVNDEIDDEDEPKETEREKKRSERRETLEREKAETKSISYQLYIAEKIFDFQKAKKNLEKKSNFYDVIQRTAKDEKIRRYKQNIEVIGNDVKKTNDLTKSYRVTPLINVLENMESDIIGMKMMINELINSMATQYQISNLETSLNQSLTKQQYELIGKSVKNVWDMMITHFKSEYEYYIKLLDNY